MPRRKIASEDGAAGQDAPVAGAGTVTKALDVLEMVAARDRPPRFAELMAEGRYPKATLFRLLQVLVAEGMLRLDPETGRYAPGLRLVRFAHAAWRDSALGPVAAPHLDALSAELGETIHLAQLDAGQVLYIDKRNAARPVEMFSAAGKVGPAYCTGVGKAMLAWLGQAELERALARQSFHRFTPRTLGDRAALLAELAAIRARGHAFDREEHEPGIHCVAVPILTGAGRMLGALSVTAAADRRPLAELAALAPRLAAAAAGIAAAAEDWRFPDR